MEQVQAFNDHYWATHTQALQFRHVAALRLLEGVSGPILDVGCGDGLFLETLQKKGMEAWGCDHSEQALGSCRARDLRVETCDLANGELPQGHASIAVSLDVLEHLYNPEKILSALHQRSSIEKIVIGVPNFASLPARIQVLRGLVPENNRPSKGHVYWFTYAVLLKMLKDAGWRVEALEWNMPWARVPIVRTLLKLLGSWRPGLIALSFVVRARRIS
jgi:SAM-dependent methyltransferase